MISSSFSFRFILAATAVVAIGAVSPQVAPAANTGTVSASTAATTETAAVQVQSAAGVTPCSDLPKGNLSDADLARLVPDQSPGKVRIRWRTETQEETYGFNIYRAEGPGMPFAKINTAILPGEGSTNIPHDYCEEDSSVVRGRTYYYYIEEVSNDGVARKLDATLGPKGEGTMVKVKTVAEEREWLKKKALGVDTSPTSGTDAQKTPAAVKPDTATSPAQAIYHLSPNTTKPAVHDPLQ